MSDIREKVSGARQPLAKILPTKLPISIGLEVTSCCNLRCEFCRHSNDEKTGRKYTQQDMLSVETAKKLADDIKQCPDIVKQVLIAGGGEPLLHKDIAEIVKVVSDAVPDRVTIVSNGTLLNRELSCELLDAGLHQLRISLNGLTREDYIRHTGRDVNPDDIYDNLLFLKEESERRKAQGQKGCFIYVKTINYMVQDEDRKNKFYKKWKTVSDACFIESLQTTSADVDLEKIADVDLYAHKFGGAVLQGEICPRPFYDCLISSRGDILACCLDAMEETYPTGKVMGNITEEHLADIWNNAKYTSFRKSLLCKKNVPEQCLKCGYWRSMTEQEDLLDADAEMLLEKYNSLGN